MNLRAKPWSLTLTGLSACVWNASALQSTVPSSEPFPPGAFSVVTFNTWRLREPSRVSHLASVLRALGGSLSPHGTAPTLPDVVLLQELEAPVATDALRAEFAPTHQFETCICALNQQHTPRSVVGLAVRSERFTVRSVQCVELGALWPDHPRCAITARIEGLAGEGTFAFTSVHLSSRPFNGAQAETLVARLTEVGALGTVPSLLAGDFNFSPQSPGYRTLTRVLRDPHDAHRGPTHWFGGRIDFTFTSEELSLVRPLDQRVAFELVAPETTLEPPARTTEPTPVSDHLPEGGVFVLGG